MQIFRGVVLVALLLALAGVAGPAAHAQSDGVRITADVNLGDDGLLRVTEQVEVPAGQDFRQVLPLRVAIGDGVERKFQVTDVKSTGEGTATVAADRFTIEARPGSSTFEYTVHNTVSDTTGAQVFQWSGVLNTDVASISATVIGPDFRMGITKCTIGPPGSPEDCADIRVEPDGVAHLEKTDLRRGDLIEVTLQLPPGTVEANADIHDDNAPGPFSLTGPVFAAFGLLLAALAAAAGYVLWARRSQPGPGATALDPIERQGDRAWFASPDGVLPGTAGLLLDGHVDPRDMASTVVDLAVRSYIWVAAVSDSDWRVTRINPADEQLTKYERTVYSALLPDGTDEVLLSELRGRLPANVVRKALISDAVQRGEFVDRNQRGFEFWTGIALIVAGVGATLALWLGPERHALVGAAIALGGVVALLLPRYLPARTALGRELTGRIQGMQRGLEAVSPHTIPAPDQEMVFSRALPFMVAWRRTDQWVRTFRDLNPTADGDPGIYWFGGFEGDRNLHRFASHFPYFITEVEKLFTR
ncbi:DUF2207 family protein [Nocardia huaxiensis]|uniref:DUF2207 domain-containing protein n=1 Tax=Nocardia huaxiensis TaxID=2755382 RepID=A0A7D6ZQI2_9NOCA|nr:DUF2207 domain-containing protein [Nocardia huaxiensis]QLY31265.1 DUF2207 domain-containing protein [Nocardia huaxiensis]UFS94805.1 DUF2207 domain-containing protein [Nocardia huaxiensis]